MRHSRNVTLIILSYTSIVAFLTVLTVPYTFLGIVGGYLFGVIFGEKYVVVATIIASAIGFLGLALGSALAFALTRTLTYSLRMKPHDTVFDPVGTTATIAVESERPTAMTYIKGLRGVLRHEGVKVNILLRICPIIPYSMINYLMPLTPCKFTDFTIGCLGTLPYVVFCSYLGTFVENIANVYTFQSSIYTYTIFVIGIILLVVIVILMAYYTRREINFMIEQQKQQTLVQPQSGDYAATRRDDGDDNGTDAPGEKEQPSQETPAVLSVEGETQRTLV